MIAGRFSFHGNCVVEPRSQFKVVGLINLTKRNKHGVGVTVSPVIMHLRVIAFIKEPYKIHGMVVALPAPPPRGPFGFVSGTEVNHEKGGQIFTVKRKRTEVSSISPSSSLSD